MDPSVVVFNFMKSIHIFSLLFFLSTITISDNHVASSTYSMNPIANTLSISYLTIITLFGFNLYMA